ncbi:unnamed protein product [Candidula unifasciata]|uniref:Uncharacterized protein n=1 Tax=Candidula unifasciata TaxID=100452 RepID=A0A8S4A0R9_9EUPU|nr:unnamed protein product [Candidula unifasciata]
MYVYVGRITVFITDHIHVSGVCMCFRASCITCQESCDYTLRYLIFLVGVYLAPLGTVLLHLQLSCYCLANINHDLCLFLKNNNIAYPVMPVCEVSMSSPL